MALDGLHGIKCPIRLSAFKFVFIYFSSANVLVPVKIMQRISYEAGGKLSDN